MEQEGDPPTARLVETDPALWKREEIQEVLWCINKEILASTCYCSVE